MHQAGSEVQPSSDLLNPSAKTLPLKLGHNAIGNSPSKPPGNRFYFDRTTSAIQEMVGRFFKRRSTCVL